MPSSLKDFQNFISDIDRTSFTSENDRKDALAAARLLCNRLEQPMEAMLRIAWVEPAYVACLKIALDIGLFKALSDGGDSGTHSVEDLARSTDTPSELLVRVLRMLACVNTISEVGDGLFSATKLCEALIQRSINACIDFRYIISGPIFQNLPAFLEQRQYQTPTELTHSPWQYAVGTKLSLFEWIGQNNDALDMFTNHMAGYTSQRGTWEEVYPVEDRLLKDIKKTNDIILNDLGGGSGHDLKRFASSFLQDAKEQRLILQELPEVIDQARRSEMLPDIVKAVPFDFTKEPPVAGARAYYMHSVLHDWPDEDVRKILEQMHPALSKPTEQGCLPKLLINENVLPKRGVRPQAAALDMIMMGAFASHERTEEQWEALLQSAGYHIVSIFSKPYVDEAIIEAEVACKI